MGARPWLAATALLAVLGAPATLAQDEDLKRLVEDTRRVGLQLLQLVKSELAKELEVGGLLRSVVVCKYSVPEIASAVSRKNGMRVTRVSLRPRNPSLGLPDAWEQAVLLDFDRRAARGEKAENLEHFEVVNEPAGRYLRYLKAIPVQSVCLNCHGPAEALSEALKMQLASEYPHDKATGYSVGQVRGAVAVKRPL